jgi:urea transport system permease protein
MAMRFLRAFFVAAVLAVASSLVAAPAARAADFAVALQSFTADSYSDTADGVAAVATSGDPLAATVIEALQDRRLMFSAASKKVYIKEKSDRLVDAATGKPAAEAAPADLAVVRINNRVRRAIDAALGALTILSPNPAKRYEAAQAVFKSKDANALEALDAALAKEGEPRVKKALQGLGMGSGDV